MTDLTVPDISRLIALHRTHLEEDRESIRVPLRMGTLIPIEGKLGTLRRGLLLDGHSEGMRSVAYSPDGRYIISESDAYSPDRYTPYESDAYSLDRHIISESDAYSSDRRYIISESDAYSPDRHIISRSFESDAYSLDRHIISESEAYSSDRRYIISESDAYSPDRHIISESDAYPPDRHIISESDAYSSDRRHIISESDAYSPGGRYIISGSADKAIRIWDAETNAGVGRAPNGEKRDIVSGRGGSYSGDIYSLTLEPGSSTPTVSMLTFKKSREKRGPPT
jgi:WD40 repeat protein